MNSDIRVECTFKGHRKRLRLRGWLGDKATDYLIDLWITVAEERPSGDLAGWDEKDIALAAGYPDDPNKFVEALIDSKWLHKTDGLYSLHEWPEHQPWVVKGPERSAIAKQAARIRWDSVKHAECMPDACPEQCGTHAPSPSPSPSPLKRRVDSDFLSSMKLRFPGVAVDAEWEDCQRWYTEHKKQMKAPQSCLINWLKKAKKTLPDEHAQRIKEAVMHDMKQRNGGS